MEGEVYSNLYIQAIICIVQLANWYAIANISPSVVKWVSHSPGALIIRVQVWIREIYSDSDDHFNGGPMSLGPIPSDM